MKRVMSVLVLLVFWGFSVAAADKDPIVAVISDQIEAFRAEDYDGAFAHASPAIREQFGTAETFGDMVERGYPMVLDPKKLRFLELRDLAGSLWQRVMILDTNGRLHLLDYQMIQQGSDWKINAVHILRAAVGSA